MTLRRIIALTVALLMLATALPLAGLSAGRDYSMPYYIEVDLTNQIVTIYSTLSKVIVRQMLCSSGEKDATPTGTYYLPEKTEKLEREDWYFFPSYNCYAQYATRIYKGVLFHSLPCSGMSESKISKAAVEAYGHPASHGCIRLLWQDAEFIAKCCLEGTRVRIFKNKKKDEELRGMLYVSGYNNETGQTYEQYMGISTDESALGRYSEGNGVRDLQTRLRDLGIFNSEINGKYGGFTVNAVREAQRLMGEEESGVATAEFQDAIYSNDAPTAQNVTVEQGMSGPVVLNMQKSLAKLKLYDGAMDGVFDADVLEAARKFQGAYAYRTDGVMTPEIQKALEYEVNKVTAMFPDDSDYDCTVSEGQISMGDVIAEVSIRLREKATAHSAALGRLLPGDKVIALEPGSEWSKVQRGTDVGYVKDQYMSFYPVDACALTYTGVDTGKTYTIGYTPREYYAGAKLPCEVFENHLAGNDSSDDAETVTYALVNTESEGGATLNLREGPNTASSILAELPHGTRVKVLLRSTEWSLVEWESDMGYLLNQYLVFVTESASDNPALAEQKALAESAPRETLPAAVRAAVGNDAPVYELDSEDAAVLGHLKNGTRLEVIETVDGWSHIDYQGHTGYMRDDDLQFMLADEVVT